MALWRWVGSRRQEYKKGLLEADRIAALEALPGWSWDPIADEWQEGFDRSTAYANEHGHCRVPAKKRIDGFGLGTFVGTCRNRHKQGRVSGEQVEALEFLPGWSREPFTDQFALGISPLREYVVREGTARMLRDHVEQGFNLGSWVSVRRSECRKGRLSKERILALEAIPGWIWDPFEEAWRQGIEHLAKYAERTGHTRVPAKHVEGDFKLGSWVNNRRNDYTKGKLRPERVSELESFSGWVWKAR